jgi:hypothetical protein
MNIQFANEIIKYYSDAYLNMSDRERVRRKMNKITSINARLEDLMLQRYYRDVFRSMVEREPALLARECPRVRYDNLANLFQSKIQTFQRRSDNTSGSHVVKRMNSLLRRRDASRTRFRFEFQVPMFWFRATRSE